jgi:hypothetical protein
MRSPCRTRGNKPFPVTYQLRNFRRADFVQMLHAIINAFAAIPVPRNDGGDSIVAVGPLHVVSGIAFDHFDVAISAPDSQNKRTLLAYRGVFRADWRVNRAHLLHW